MISIVDYGLGNLGSIRNMLKRLGAFSEVVSDAAGIGQAKALILPGVGAFDHGMNNIRSRNLECALRERVLNQKVPVLGICLGMQLLTERSEEGVLPGLGWVPGETVRFQFDDATSPGQRPMRIPHMGWNAVTTLPLQVLPPFSFPSTSAAPSVQSETSPHRSPLFRSFEASPRFYFVHSYHVVCRNRENIVGESRYGGLAFCSAVQHGNIYGVQFHPEKSHRFGLQLMKNFVEDVT